MKTKSRRKARETALKILYECEVGNSELAETIEESLLAANLSPDLGDYTRLLVHGVADNQEKLDEELDQLLTKYDLMRVAAIDRNVLRIGAFEIAYLSYIPPKVSINEAIEIVRKFSTAESGRFINGVLGRFMEQGNRAEFSTEVEEEAAVEEPVEIEESVVESDSKEAIEAQKLGLWKLRADEGNGSE